MLTSVLSNILERLLDEGNKYIVNFINLVVLAAMLNRLPIILRDTKVAFLQQECRLQFQTRGVRLLFKFPGCANRVK